MIRVVIFDSVHVHARGTGTGPAHYRRPTMDRSTVALVIFPIEDVSYRASCHCVIGNINFKIVRIVDLLHVVVHDS